MIADPDEGQPETVTDTATETAADEAELIAGRYRLISAVGGGSMGVVWRARDEKLGRDVAVKELRPDTTMSGAEVRQSHLRARREGRIAARLQHPNAVTVYDVAEHDGRPYLIMEFVPSSSLGEILSTGTVLPPAEVARIGSQLASALAAAHAVGIVHRDIKPGNVLMTASGGVKLTDFGISRATGDAAVTATGEILGTPAYTAPEVAHGHDADFPADVFSLGSTLYAAVEGTPPFGDEVNAMAVLLRVVHNEIRPPRRSGVLTDTLMRMLSPEPAHRPTMKEVGETLRALSVSPPRVVDVPLAGGDSGEAGGLLLSWRRCRSRRRSWCPRRCGRGCGRPRHRRSRRRHHRRHHRRRRRRPRCRSPRRKPRRRLRNRPPRISSRARRRCRRLRPRTRRCRASGRANP